jgi:hypothetical protein
MERAILNWMLKFHSGKSLGIDINPDHRKVD